MARRHYPSVVTFDQVMPGPRACSAGHVLMVAPPSIDLPAPCLRPPPRLWYLENSRKKTASSNDLYGVPLMDADTSLAGAFPRYSLVDCVVSAHRPYGLIVAVARRYRGFVDLDHISHVPIAADDWPAVGSKQRGLVLGETNDGRLRLDLRKDDLHLAEHAVDFTHVMARWAEIRQGAPGDAQTRHRFFESPDAARLLAWLASGRSRGAPMALIWDLVGGSSEVIRREVAWRIWRSSLSP